MSEDMQVRADSRSRRAGRRPTIVDGLDLFGDVSTLDTGGRSALDFYETPTWMTRSLLVHHPAIAGTRVLEPASGRDAIARVLREEARCQVVTNDMDTRHPAQMHFDATDPAFWLSLQVRADWVVSNFPFDVAFGVLPYALEHALVGVAVLLRKTFTEPTEDRGPWLAAHPPTRVIGEPRHKFRAGTKSGDSVSADWFIWERTPDRSLPPFVIDHVAKSRTGRPA